MSKKKVVKVKLIGEDGNVFNVIGRTARALEKGGEAKKAIEFRERAFKCHSYGEVLALATEYCEVR